MKKYEHLFHIYENGNNMIRLKSGDISARIDFLSEQLLRVAVYPENAELLPTYSIAPDAKMPREGRPRLSVEGFPGFIPEKDGEFCFKWKDYRLEIKPENLLLSIWKNNERLLEDRGPLAMNLGGEFGRGQRHYLRRNPEEQIFGLGDKSGSMNKSGRRFRLECFDAMGYDSEHSDPLYKHIPFFIYKNSTGNAGLFYDTHAPCVFDFGQEISNYTGSYRYFSVQEDVLVYYILLGSMAEIITGFSRLTGGTAMPPRSSLLFAGSTMAYTDADDCDRLLRGFADDCQKKRFTCGGFYLSSGYTSVGKRRYVFNWNRHKIPDPEDLADYFKKHNIDLIANIKPVFLTDHPLYQKIADSGWFLKYSDGTPALTCFWDGLGSWLDFTNPEAYDFWKKQVRTMLLDRGIRFTWNDNNEYEILDESIIACGFGKPVPAFLIRPVFPLLMAMASLEAQNEAAPGLQFVSCRSGCAGLSRVAGTWSGDNSTEWKTLRYNHKMGLTMSISGLHNFGHDIGGFSGDAPEQELFLRWIQHGVLMPRFVIHSWNNDGSATTPWFFPEAEKAVRSLFAFRQRILPYLYDAFFRSHSRNEPIIRPLFYLYPDEDVESDLFMISDGLLAACVFDKGINSLSLRLPEEPQGWYLGNKWYPGGTSVTVSSPVEDLPVCFFRGGSIILEDDADYSSDAVPEYRICIYAGNTGSISRSFYIDEEFQLEIKAEFREDKVPVQCKYVGNGICPDIPKIILFDQKKERRQISFKPVTKN